MAALAVLTSAAAVVSWDAQYNLVQEIKGVPAVAAQEAGIPDVGAIIFAALGIALALHGRRAVRPRSLNALASETLIGGLLNRSRCAALAGPVTGEPMLARVRPLQGGFRGDSMPPRMYAPRTSGRRADRMELVITSRGEAAC